MKISEIVEAAKLSPDAYKQQNGKCPPGFTTDDNGKCQKAKGVGQGLKRLLHKVSPTGDMTNKQRSQWRSEHSYASVEKSK